MSFDSTKNSISTLSSGSSIALDEMFEMFESVFDDVCEFNNSDEISSFSVVDQKNLLQRFRSIMSILISAYKDNKSGINEFSSTLQEKFRQLESEYNTIEPELSKIVADVEELKRKESEIKICHDKCMAKSTELVTIDAHCKQMQAEIDSMSDLDLETLKQTEASLTTELQTRRSQKEMLDEKIRNVKQAKESIDLEIGRLTTTDTALAEELDTLTADKNSLEANISYMQTQIDEIKKWKENFPEYSRNIEEEFTELEAQVKAIINMWNSVHTDPFLAKALSENLGEQFFGEDSNVKELKDIDVWFERLLGYLDNLSQEAKKRIECLTANISKITNSQNK